MIALLALTAVSMAPGYAVPLPTVPGVANPAVTQANIGQTICNKVKQANGFTWIHNQRPSASYTNKIKFALMAAAGIPRSQAPLFELDHDWSIEAGGNPRSPSNLWLQPWAGKWGAHTKDRLENLEHKLICNGTITVAQAGHELTTDWVAAWLARIGNESEAGK